VTVECLECGASIAIPLDADEGDTVNCGKCGEVFVIVALHPIEIDYADGDGDDEWDEEWMDEDEDEDDGEEDDEDF
jgi:predicted Zn finger-like uncharacterized protein